MLHFKMKWRYLLLLKSSVRTLAAPAAQLLFMPLCPIFSHSYALFQGSPYPLIDVNNVSHPGAPSFSFPRHHSENACLNKVTPIVSACMSKESHFVIDILLKYQNKLVHLETTNYCVRSPPPPFGNIWRQRITVYDHHPPFRQHLETTNYCVRSPSPFRQRLETTNYCVRSPPPFRQHLETTNYSVRSPPPLSATF